MTSPRQSPHLSPTLSPAMSRAQAAGVGGPLDSLGPKLALHLESDFGVTTVANKVAEWASRAGWRNTVVQDVDANRPTLVANVLDGKPAVRFGGSQWLQALAQVGVAAGDFPRVYVVASYATALTSFASVLLNYDNGVASNRGFSIGHFSNFQNWLALRGGATRFTQPVTAAGNNSIPVLFDGRNEVGSITLAINGLDQPVGAGAAGGLDLTPDAIRVGQQLDGSQRLVGDLFSIVVLTNPTPEMHAFVFEYIAGKYPSLGLPRQRPPLPASAVEYWHSELGASSANASGQIAGTTIAGVNTPAVQSDPPHFNGRNVYYAVAAGASSKYWAQATLASPLLSIGARPYVCAILRTRNTIGASGLYSGVSWRGGTHAPVGELAAILYDTNKYAFQRFRSGAANVVLSSANQDTNAHFFECYVDATTGMQLLVDGIQTGGNAETAGLPSTIDALGIGCILTGAGVGVVDTSRNTNTSLAFWLICSAVPSAGERAALRSWAQSYWATP